MALPRRSSPRSSRPIIHRAVDAKGKKPSGRSPVNEMSFKKGDEVRVRTPLGRLGTTTLRLVMWLGAVVVSDADAADDNGHLETIISSLGVQIRRGHRIQSSPMSTSPPSPPLPHLPPDLGGRHRRCCPEDPPSPGHHRLPSTIGLPPPPLHAVHRHCASLPAPAGSGGGKGVSAPPAPAGPPSPPLHAVSRHRASPPAPVGSSGGEGASRVRDEKSRKIDLISTGCEPRREKKYLIRSGSARF
uniref:Uncharacterized protein n=1 Tax=Oryza glumipatula TaxID=40148 RepID=A0A0E0AKH4_9ORYZ